MVVDWKAAQSGTGEDGYFNLGVFQIRRQYRGRNHHTYTINFLPYSQFQDVFEEPQDTEERARFMDREYLYFAESKCVANGIAIGMLERIRAPRHVNDPIVESIELLLRNRAPAKLSKAEILSLTGLQEGQWSHFLVRRPGTIALESHGRGARYWFIGDAAAAQRDVPREADAAASGPAQGPRPPVPSVRFGSLIGQAELKERLETYIRAARDRNEPLDHVLLAGPPGLGKSTLAEIIAGELGKPLHMLMAPSLTTPGLTEAMGNVQDGEIVFIDEIHRLGQAQQEQLFSAMKRPITIVAATNFPAQLLPSLSGRFSITESIRLYTMDELVAVISRATEDAPISDKVAQQVARRSRGTPRTALALLRRLRDLNGLTEDSIEAAFATLQIDRLGLTAKDREYLLALSRASAPVGVDALASTLNESADTIEQVIEPFLLQQAFIERTPRGRVITDKGRAHLSAAKRASQRRGAKAQQDLIQ